MEPKRWSGTLMMGVITVVLGCNPATPPTVPQASETPVRRTKSPSTAPSKAPAVPTPTSTASAGAQPATSPTASTGGTPITSAAPSVAPSPTPSAVATSLATTNPTLAALGCKPAGAEVPVASAPAGTPVAAVYGHAAIPALNVTRGATVSIKPPPPIDVVLTAHPGAPAARITAYQVSFLAGPDGDTTAIGASTRITIPAVDLPAAPTTHFGRPVAVPVVLPVGLLKGVLADAGTAPTLIKAEVRFFNDAGNEFVAKSLATLVASLPLPLGATAGAAERPAAEACAGSSPSPFVPPALVAGGGVDTAVMEWREVSPYTVTRSAAGVLSQTNVGIALAAPPGGTGARIDSLEATYQYTTAADVKDGKPPTQGAPVVTNLTPPVVVAAGTASAYGASAFATLPFSDSSLAGLTGAEGVVVVTFTFKNKETGTINGADGKPLKVTVPILVE